MSWIPSISQCSAIAPAHLPGAGWLGYIIPTVIEVTCAGLIF